MRRLVRVGQVWWDADGDFAWRVANIHRKDGLVELQCERGPFLRPEFVTFGELGKRYELEGER